MPFLVFCHCRLFSFLACSQGEGLALYCPTWVRAHCSQQYERPGPQPPLAAESDPGPLPDARDYPCLPQVSEGPSTTPAEVPF